MESIRHTTGARAFERAMLAAAALWLALAGEPAHTGDVYSEEAVKAAFVLRFTSYVTWPNPPAAGEPFRIAVLGDAAMASRLQALVEDRSVDNHPIQVMQIASTKEMRNVRLLYIGSKRNADLPALLPDLRDRGILVVTDASNGLDAGGAINFIIVDQRVRFEASMEAARRAGVVISSELLSVAVRVRGHAQHASAREEPR